MVTFTLGLAARVSEKNANVVINALEWVCNVKCTNISIPVPVYPKGLHMKIAVWQRPNGDMSLMWSFKDLHVGLKLKTHEFQWRWVHCSLARLVNKLSKLTQNDDHNGCFWLPEPRGVV